MKYQQLGEAWRRLTGWQRLVVEALLLHPTDQFLAPLVEPPDVAAERVLVSKSLHAELAGDKV